MEELLTKKARASDASIGAADSDASSAGNERRGEKRVDFDALLFCVTPL